MGNNSKPSMGIGQQVRVTKKIVHSVPHPAWKQVAGINPNRSIQLGLLEYTHSGCKITKATTMINLVASSILSDTASKRKYFCPTSHPYKIDPIHHAVQNSFVHKPIYILYHIFYAGSGFQNVLSMHMVQ